MHTHEVVCVHARVCVQKYFLGNHLTTYFGNKSVRMIYCEGILGTIRNHGCGGTAAVRRADLL